LIARDASRCLWGLRRRHVARCADVIRTSYTRPPSCQCTGRRVSSAPSARSESTTVHVDTRACGTTHDVPAASHSPARVLCSGPAEPGRLPAAPFWGLAHGDTATRISPGSTSAIQQWLPGRLRRRAADSRGRVADAEALHLVGRPLRGVRLALFVRPRGHRLSVHPLGIALASTRLWVQ